MIEIDASTEFSDDAYGEITALRYSTVEGRPSGFAMQAAPWIWQYFDQADIPPDHRRLLDVGCGTGDLAAYLLDRGVELTGLDRSPHMLEHAAEKNGEYVRSGRAMFVEADASDFRLPEEFGMAVSTFNTLNHLADFEAVEKCLASVSKALVPGASFLFDINTRRGLESTVGTNVVIDTDEEIIFRKRIRFENRVILYATGCFLHDGRWHPYRETIAKIFISTTELRRALLKAGFESVVFTAEDFRTEIDDPEAEEIARVVAIKEKM